MSFNNILIWLFAIGCIIGGIDRIIGNKLGLGDKFEEGFNSMGPLALSMVGILCLAPVIASILSPVVVPMLSAIGCDPAIFGSILPIDTGGYPLAMSLAVNPQAGLYSGLIVASMLGCTITVLIPLGLGMIEKKDSPYYANGLLIGMISIPFGSVIGGAIGGFDMKMVLMNTIPVAVIALLFVIGLKLSPIKMIRGCEIFGQFIKIVGTIGIAAAAFEFLTGVTIIPGMTSIVESLGIIAQIAIVLLGAYPVLNLITKALNKPLTALGKMIGLDSVSATAIIIMAANPIPIYSGSYKDMSSRGKIASIAWHVCAAGALGDHLGFTAGVHPEYITAVVLGKILGGVVGLIFALLLTQNTDVVDRRSKDIEQSLARKENAAAI